MKQKASFCWIQNRRAPASTTIVERNSSHVSDRDGGRLRPTIKGLFYAKRKYEPRILYEPALSD
jgi:hypothetical protein